MIIACLPQVGIVIIQVLLGCCRLQVGVEGRPARIQPRERLAVVGIVLPFTAGISHRPHQADLITVIDGRGAGHCHLQDDGCLQARDGVAPVIGRVGVQGWIIQAGVFIQHEEHPAGIVAVKQVQHGLQSFRRVTLRQAADAVVKCGGCQRDNQTRRTAAGMIIIGEGGGAPEAQRGGAELVIHHPIPLVAQQPGGGIAPLLAGDVGIRPDGVHRGAEFLPVGVGRVAGHTWIQVTAHIQAPAIGPLQPERRHRGRPVGVHQVADFRVVRVEGGQAVVAPPRAVIGGHRRAVRAGTNTRPGGHIGEGEPRPVRRGRTFAGTDFAVARVAVKVNAVRGDVVEYAVQDDMDAAGVRLGRQAGEQGLVSHGWVDCQVIAGIVTMIGGGEENRVEVNGRHTQTLQVIQLVHQALQVTAVEVLGISPAAGGGSRTRIAHGSIPIRTHGAVHCPAGLVVEECSRRRVIGSVAVAETVREDLVYDRILDPVRRLVSRIIDRQLVGIIRRGGKRLAPTAVAGGIVLIIRRGRAVNGDEAVPVHRWIGRCRNGGLPPFVGIIRRSRRHIEERLGIGAVVVEAHPGCRQVAGCRPQAQGDRRAGGHRSAGGAVKGIPAVMAKAGKPNVVVMAGAGVGSRDKSDSPGTRIQQVEENLPRKSRKIHVAGIYRASVAAKAIPTAGVDHLAGVRLRGSRGVVVLVTVVPVSGHHRGGIRIVPPIEGTNRGERSGIIPDIDDVHGRKVGNPGIRAVIVGIKCEFDGLIAGGGIEPTVARGWIGC